MLTRLAVLREFFKLYMVLFKHAVLLYLSIITLSMILFFQFVSDLHKTYPLSDTDFARHMCNVKCISKNLFFLKGHKKKLTYFLICFAYLYSDTAVYLKRF